MSDTLSALVGTKFRGAQAITCIAQMRVGDGVRLEREPNNQHDAKAIACHYLGQHVGYIPRIVNERIAPLMDRGIAVTATVERVPVIEGGRVKSEPRLLLTWDAPV